MPHIKSISLGTIFSVTDILCDGLDECGKVSGCYRSLKEPLIKLAEFYLSGCTGHTITWFGEPYTFFVALGMDGAPFGKDDTACAWLVSLLNIGNYLLFGANCSENGIVVQKFIKMLLADICDIEKRFMICSHNGKQVNIKFSIGELPNDMKMLAFLSGELSNSAKCFSSSANVCNDNANATRGTFGRSNQNTWTPWNYCDGVKQSLADSSVRSKVTTFIAQN